MLGAVRHKGFIPWDDNIDIGIPRKDYDQLLKLLNDNKLTNLYVYNKYTAKDCSYDFTKICKKINLSNGKIQEIFLDIFPLDGCPATSKNAIKKIYNKFDFMRLKKNSHFMKLEGKNFLKRFLVKLWRRKSLNYYQSKMDCFLRKNDFYSSPTVGNYSGHWREKELMPKNVYGKPTLIYFEDGFYYGVENPHKYLSAMYGDYMRIPDEKERLSHFDEN